MFDDTKASPMTDRTTMNTVTQADRDAAAKFCGVDISDGKKVRGAYDAIYGPTGYGNAVQAFARHRIEAQSSPTADDGLVEARRLAAREVEGDSDNPLRVREANAIYDGLRDDSELVQRHLAALSRQTPSDDRAAVEAERERCARIAESMDPNTDYYGPDIHLSIAAAIRAPSTPSPTRTQDDE